VHAVTPDSAPREPIDDVTLTRKVESEIFRDADAPKDRISVNTEHGVVYLRGEVDRPEQIESLVAGAQKVQGVERVENLLHLPGTPAPMKQ
jgi:osmotically-inducible protein OsmY